MSNPTKDPHVKISISLTTSTLNQLDDRKKLATRSAYIEDILKKQLKIRGSKN